MKRQLYLIYNQTLGINDIKVYVILNVVGKIKAIDYIEISFIINCVSFQT